MLAPLLPSLSSTRTRQRSPQSRNGEANIVQRAVCLPMSWPAYAWGLYALLGIEPMPDAAAGELNAGLPAWQVLGLARIQDVPRRWGVAVCWPGRGGRCWLPGGYRRRRDAPMQQYTGRSVIARWFLHNHRSGVEGRSCHPRECPPGLRPRAVETGTHARLLTSGTNCMHVQTLQHFFTH